MTKNNKPDPNHYPTGWDAKRVHEVLEYYENQTEDEAVAEAEAAFADPNSTVMVIPHDLVPQVRALLAQHKSASQASTGTRKPKRPARRRTVS